ncbi:MAG: Lrp/AsnC family transcriptional regulator [Thaumarchaeota archaeon]|jgi:Lrp/AsnC family transcriptional regulator for asnA, asnC and gidA|nr:Lrp/AsnC family transcriptional regulator [Candidatus Terraquivivens yellowstonensis]MCL7392729.1 Lrp/AsnC family transcriptional regulator [Candidatus Terraquivivens yellowstonensis]MCL7395164.1 Lrp/AsnC family transcriptional regulator [Candidatus Terraquivivens yellowstonensis]MCL7398392.1 Lrp/AsnC family transcriptional regulator [Candidatus Terraquivivens yellowstonensis]MCL7398717.1 Lrp/AsnC family transcriptional regulator [Candidatus Terraquivivens yellowstonensis]
MKAGLDEKDLMILNILQENGRASYSEIAKKLGISEAAVYGRIKKLIKQGYIKKFQAVIDENKIGKMMTAFVAVKAQPHLYDKVLEALVSFPEVQEVHDVTGDYYCLLKLKVKDREALAKILDEIGKMDGVVSTETRVVLRTLKESPNVYIFNTSSS